MSEYQMKLMIVWRGFQGILKSTDGRLKIPGGLLGIAKTALKICIIGVSTQQDLRLFQGLVKFLSLLQNMNIVQPCAYESGVKFKAACQ